MSTNFNIIDLLKRTQPRQPWDERLPSGQSVPDLLRQTATGPASTGTGTAMPQPPSGNPAIQRASLGVPRGGVLELLKQPTMTSPTSPASPTTGAPPPPGEGRALTPEPVRIGTDTRGMNPQQAQQAYVDLLRQSSPSSKIRRRDGFIEAGPPEQSPSRVKNALLGLLLGTAQGGLPGGIAGAATGAVKPELIQQLLRDRQIAKQEGQLESQLGIDAKRAGIEHTRAETDALQQGRRQYVERTDGVYEISREYPNGRRVADIPSEVRAKPAASRHYFERDDGVYYVDDEHPQGVKLQGVPGKPVSDAQTAQAAEGEALAQSTQAAANELKATLDQQKAQLTTNEAAIRQKEAAWRVEAQRRYDELHKKVKEKDEKSGKEIEYDPHVDDKRTVKDFIEEARAADADYQKGVYDETVENTKRLRDAISEGDKRFAAMQQDVRQGQAKGARRGGRGTASATTHAFSIGAYLSRNKGATEADARAYAKQHYPEYEVVP